MLRYIVRRLLLVFPVAFAISALVFVLIRFAPGDPVMTMLGMDYSPEAEVGLRHQLGLDQSIPVQYVLWLGRVLQGDLGRAIFSREPVLELILYRLPTTLILTLSAMVVALVIAVPVGIVSATHNDTIFDNVGRLLAVLGVSVPVFWLGLILLILFSATLRWFPLGGTFQEYGPKAVVLPAVALGTGLAALIMRMIRSSLLEVLDEDYIRTARAKGLRQSVVITRHALKNVMIPVVTVVGLQFGMLLGGAVLTETVFNLPGLGRLLVESIMHQDYPIIQGCVLVICLSFVIVNLLVDISYVLFDPQIGYN